MICCMTCPWVSSLKPPVSSPSRPRRTLSPFAASLVAPTIVNVDCIRTLVRIHYPTGRRRLVTNRRHHLVAGCSRPTELCRHHPAGLCRHRPAGLCRHRPAGLCRHRPAGLCRHRCRFSVPTISSMLSKSAISVANASKTRWRTPPEV